MIALTHSGEAGAATTYMANHFGPEVRQSVSGQQEEAAGSGGFEKYATYAMVPCALAVVVIY